ncbi:Putative SKP1/BTB/POZ domain superfamily protein [Septoria linicola]|uniref:SKP1/BTB/POZ domain superfamily protein n=1 Tax=Septoria linicola TaxID=215465 RepID=A0A9Q9ANV8_9PEZI|nr:putative SKP1/BTB/POZ domain superfamily protein [Septoria linicola]USW52400.1 Putative SKP1/BTB/POZ domain superfamily protein [Septoria linicola]
MAQMADEKPAKSQLEQLRLTASSDLPSTPDKRPALEDFDKVVRICVGKEGNAHVFEMHRGVLKFYSGHFHKAILHLDFGRFPIAEQTIVLDQEEVETFRLFQGWAYTRAIDPIEPMTAVKLWVFGHRRAIPLLQNEMIDYLWAKVINRSKLWQHCLVFAYRNTPPGSLLRDFMLTTTVMRSGRPQIFPDTNDGWWTDESLRDAARMLISRPAIWTQNQMESMDQCYWHVHQEGVKCQASVKNLNDSPVVHPNRRPLMVGGQAS